MADIFTFIFLVGLIALIIYFIKYRRSRSDLHKKRLYMSMGAFAVGFFGFGVFSGEADADETEVVEEIEQEAEEADAILAEANGEAEQKEQEAETTLAEAEEVNDLLKEAENNDEDSEDSEEETEEDSDNESEETEEAAADEIEIEEENADVEKEGNEVPEEIEDLTITDTRDDMTGNWRKAVTSSNVNMPDNAIAYYEEHMEEDELHHIISFATNTTTMINDLGHMLIVDITEYEDGEEHSVDTIGSGMLYTSYNVYKDSEEIEELEVE